MTSIAASDARARRLLPLYRTLFQLGRWQRHPLISVLIATFNRGQLLAEQTIPSILGQTYRNFEIVVVGDGCSDDTGERLSRLRDSRIRWENLPKRGVYPEDPFHRWLVAGTPPANRGLDTARGRWIAYCDDDDTWTDDHLAVLLDHAQSGDAELVYAAMMFQRSADEWLRIGGAPPVTGNVPSSTILYRSYLKAFRYDNESWKEGMAGDAQRWRRMLEAGVRFRYADRVVAHSPLRPGDELRGQRAAEEARRAWMAEGSLETMQQPAGYLHPAYAASFSEFAQPRELPRSRSSILTRAIPGTNLFDAMGCYPLFLCSDWSSLADDLSGVDPLVSLVVVTDPFADASVETLRRCFPDVLRPFKEHFVVDLSRSSLSRRRRTRTRRMLQEVAVEATFEPIAYLDEWEGLYRHLCERLNIQGLMAFSRQAFQVQLAVPGCVGFVARAGGSVVSMALWYINGEVAYYHLAASDEEGYRLSASHVLMPAAMEVMAEQRVRWLDLGAGAGTDGGPNGLTRFKQMWATGTRTAYLGGRIFRPADYAALAVKTKGAHSGYFPAYRSGEFG